MREYRYGTFGTVAQRRTCKDVLADVNDGVAPDEVQKALKAAGYSESDAVGIVNWATRHSGTSLQEELEQERNNIWTYSEAARDYRDYLEQLALRCKPSGGADDDLAWADRELAEKWDELWGKMQADLRKCEEAEAKAAKLKDLKKLRALSEEATYTYDGLCWYKEDFGSVRCWSKLVQDFRELRLSVQKPS